MGNSIRHLDFSASHMQERACLKGHIIDNQVIWPDQPAQEWCHVCGSAVTGECPECKGPLRGASNYKPLPVNPKPDAYCLHCGKAFPWTQMTLAAAREYTDDLDGLSEEEKVQLKGTFEDMTTDTARTPVATGRFKRLMTKAGPEAGKGLMQVIVSVVTDEVKRHLHLIP
jgi:hypothetical protein